MHRALFVLFVLASVCALPATVAAATVYVTGLPGVACAPATPQGAISFDHQGGTLRNTGTASFQMFCPVPPSVPKKDPFEVRIQIIVAATDDPKKVPECSLVTARPTGPPRTAPPSDGASDGTVATVVWIIADPADAIAVHTTVSCLLPPGAEVLALERLSE